MIVGRATDHSQTRFDLRFARRRLFRRRLSSSSRGSSSTCANVPRCASARNSRADGDGCHDRSRPRCPWSAHALLSAREGRDAAVDDLPPYGSRHRSTNRHVRRAPVRSSDAHVLSRTPTSPKAPRHAALRRVVRSASARLRARLDLLGATAWLDMARRPPSINCS